MDLTRLVLLGLASAAGAVINSIAGGGSIVSFPVAVALGLPPVTAAATNLVAVAPGYFAAAYAYRRELGDGRRELPWLLVPAMLGAIGGALVLVSAPARSFELIAPWLVLGATVLLLVRDRIAKLTRASDEPPSRGRRWAVAIALGLLAVYGGYFGAGMGILTLALIALLRRQDIHRMNAQKTIVVGGINGVAAVLFLASGAADLTAALAMAIGAASGGFLAASVARRFDPKIVGWVVAAIGVGLSVMLAARFWF